VIIIPAIDLKGGNCVRLLQGRMDAETVFSTDPAAMAQKWASLGAEVIHVVDLDGAIEKSPVNKTAIRAIVEALTVPVQVGGGIRNMESIELFFDIGVRRVIIGTEAVRNPQLVVSACKKYPGRIIVGIDARNGLVAVDGWTKTTDTTAIELAKRFENCGVAAINFTDIHRDGMQTGPNIEETRRLAEAVSIPVVASGGVGSIEDIKNLLPLESSGVIGIITGRAIYTGALDLAEAIRIAGKQASPEE
jgi:phosphoribosylformimino-5-aminoimidazole carboxamide ribotide isomerase